MPDPQKKDPVGRWVCAGLLFIIVFPLGIFMMIAGQIFGAILMLLLLFGLVGALLFGSDELLEKLARLPSF